MTFGGLISDEDLGGTRPQRLRDRDPEWERVFGHLRDINNYREYLNDLQAYKAALNNRMDDLYAELGGFQNHKVHIYRQVNLPNNESVLRLAAVLEMVPYHHEDILPEGLQFLRNPITDAAAWGLSCGGFYHEPEGVEGVSYQWWSEPLLPFAKPPYSDYVFEEDQ